MSNPGKPSWRALAVSLMKPSPSLALALLSLAGLLLRLAGLGQQSFWNDEILTIDRAGGSLLETISGARERNILPLYYLTIRGFLEGDPAEFWLRLPSVFFGTLAIPVYYLVIRRWGGTVLGLTGAAVLSFSPFHVWYSQEARPYALLLLLALLALWLLQLGVERPTRHRQAAAVVAAAATFYCHTIGLGFILFLAAYVLLAVPRHRWKEWALPAAGVALLLAPGLIRLLLIPPVGSEDVYKQVTLWSLGYIAWAFATGYSLGPSTTEVLGDPPAQVVGSHLLTIALVGGFLGTLLFTGILVLRRQSLVLRSVLAWLLLPSGFALAAALATVHPLNVRYTILAFPAYLLLLATGLRGVPAGRFRMTAGLLLAAIGVWSLHNYFTEPRYWRDDNRGAGEYLSTHALEGDLVVATAGYTAQNLRYYYSGEPLTIVAYPADGGRPEVIKGPRFEPAVTGARYVTSDAVGTDLEDLTAGHDRVWLFASRTYHSDPQSLVAQWLDRGMCRAVERRWPGVELRLYLGPRPAENCRSLN